MAGQRREDNDEDLEDQDEDELDQEVHLAGCVCALFMPHFPRYSAVFAMQPCLHSLTLLFSLLHLLGIPCAVCAASLEVSVAATEKMSVVSYF